MGERRRLVGLDRDQPGRARAEVGHHLAQSRHVEEIAHALPRGLEQHGEPRVPARLPEEIGAPLPLLPEGGAASGEATREQQRSGRDLSEDGGEHRRPREHADHGLFDLVGLEHEILDRDPFDGLGEPQDDPVVGPQHLRAGPETLLHPSLDRERPGRMHARAERGQDADPPVAQLVAEAFDDDRPIVRDRAPGGFGLFVDVGDEVPRGALVEPDVLTEPAHHVVAPRGAELAREPPDRPAELDRSARTGRLPEGELPVLARRGNHDHAVARDVLDPPGARAEQDDLAAPGLVHALFVQLADPRAVGHEDPEQPPVGDRPARDDRQAPGSLACADHVRRSIPDDAWPQLREGVGRVAARQHVEHREEQVLGELGEAGAPPHRVEEVLDAPLIDRGHRDQLLREHVERVARVPGGLDVRAQHPLCHDRHLEQVAPVLGDELADAGRPHLVSGPADPLEPAGDGRRRFHLHHEVDRTHVDPELERRRRDDASEPPVLERILDLQALLARDRPVMRPHEVLVRELVQPRRQPFGAPPVVDEHDRGAVRADQIEQHRVDGRPDRGVIGLIGELRVRCLDRPDAEIGHVVDGNDDLQGERLAAARVDHGDVTQTVRRFEAAEESRDLLQRTLRGGQPDPLGRVVHQRLEPLQRQHQMGAALRRRDRVDLVDDHGPNAPQRLPGGGREHQVERFGRGDEDVGRVRQQSATLAGIGVARAHPHRGHVRERQPASFRRVLDARERRPEVLLDVDREGAERRDVEHRGAPVPAGRWGRGRVGRSRPGTRRASCPSRWAPTARCGVPRRSPPSLWSGHRWAPRTNLRTKRAWRGRRQRATRSSHATR